MKTPLFKLSFVIVLLLTSCTGGGGSEGVGSSILDPVKEIIGGGTPADVKQTQTEVIEIQKTINNDPPYQITADDQDFLMSESIIDDQSEIKSWVK